jgi:ribosomal protein L37AE/L43A
MDNDFDIYLGEETEEQCPKCDEGYLWRDKTGVEWCSHCEYSNDEGMSEFMRLILDKTKN